ncbi:MAG: trehalase family glycosidase [Polyangiales bacterium]
MSSKFNWLQGEVRALYDRNRQQGHAAWANLDYDFVCPSAETYPFQWFWDSCFHAVALTHVDLERAKSEVRGLLANIHDDGMISHVTFWQRERYEEMLSTYAIAYRTPYLSDCMQPPVIADTVLHIVERGGGVAFAKETAPALKRYHDWLDRVRDPDRDGLIATLQSDESGLDHTPKYDAYRGMADGGTMKAQDAAWRRVADAYTAVGRDSAKMFETGAFIVEDTLVNAIYAKGLSALAKILDIAGDAAGAEEMRRRALKTTDALVEKCFDSDAGLFFDLAGKEEKPLRVSTVSSLVPLVLEDLPEWVVDRVARHIEDPKAYASKYPVPSVSMAEPSFVPGYLEKLVWRGPTWINTNWYIARGLRTHGLPELARRIEQSSVALIEKSSFKEYYHPHTGEGYGAPDFSWSALALDMAAAEGA